MRRLQCILHLGLMIAGLAVLPAGCRRQTAENPGPKPKPDPPAPQPGDVLTTGAELGKWTHDLDAARELAAAGKLPLLLLFTGSDWCPACRLMDARVLQTKTWKDYAAKHVVQVKIDFPADPKLVPKQYRDRNEVLQTEWRVNEYPTFLLLNAAGDQELGRIFATRDVTPEGFIGRLRAVLHRQSRRPEPVHLMPVEIVPRVGRGQPVKVAKTGAAPGRWTEDLDAAKALAKEKQLPLFVHFTGSDWCSACRAVKEQVFSRASWQRYAKKRFVLACVDYPRLLKQPEAVRQRNEALARKYHIEGFPTFILFESDGETMAGRVQSAASAHQFRENVEQTAAMLTSRIRARARKMGETDGAAYEKKMLQLRQSVANHDRLLAEASRLRAVGALTPEFKEDLVASAEAAEELMAAVRRFEHRLQARELGGETGKKYLKLQEDLAAATRSLQELMLKPPADPDEFERKHSERRRAVVTITTAIEDLEAAHFAETLDAKTAKDYRDYREELQRVEKSFAQWLRTNPPQTPENMVKYDRYRRRIERLQDELDAIRDGV